MPETIPREALRRRHAPLAERVLGRSHEALGLVLGRRLRLADHERAGAVDDERVGPSCRRRRSPAPRRGYASRSRRAIVYLATVVERGSSPTHVVGGAARPKRSEPSALVKIRLSRSKVGQLDLDPRRRSAPGRSRRFVPGIVRLMPWIGTMSWPRWSTQASASCAGVTSFSAAISSTLATSGSPFASAFSGLNHGLVAAAPVRPHRACVRVKREQPEEEAAAEQRVGDQADGELTQGRQHLVSRRRGSRARYSVCTAGEQVRSRQRGRSSPASASLRPTWRILPGLDLLGRARQRSPRSAPTGPYGASS